MRKLFVACVVALLSIPAYAVETTITWSLGETNCEGEPSAPVTAVEIYVSETPIPASDEECGGAVDVPPDFAQRIEGSLDTNSATIDLIGGRTYYIRMRVSGPGGVWSNLSNETVRALPSAPLRAPVIINLS